MMRDLEKRMILPVSLIVAILVALAFYYIPDVKAKEKPSPSVVSQNVFPNPWPSGEETTVIQNCYDCSPDVVRPDAAIGFEFPVISTTGSHINNAPPVEIKCASWEPKPTGCKLQHGKTLDDLTYVLVEREKTRR